MSKTDNTSISKIDKDQDRLNRITLRISIISLIVSTIIATASVVNYFNAKFARSDQLAAAVYQVQLKKLDRLPGELIHFISLKTLPVTDECLVLSRTFNKIDTNSEEYKATISHDAGTEASEAAIQNFLSNLLSPEQIDKYQQTLDSCLRSNILRMIDLSKANIRYSIEFATLFNGIELGEHACLGKILSNNTLSDFVGSAVTEKLLDFDTLSQKQLSFSNGRERLEFFTAFHNGIVSHTRAQLELSDMLISDFKYMAKLMQGLSEALGIKQSSENWQLLLKEHLPIASSLAVDDSADNIIDEIDCSSISLNVSQLPGARRARLRRSNSNSIQR